MTGRRRRWAMVAGVLAVLVVAGTVLTVVLVNRKPSSYGAVDCASVSAALTSGLAALERQGPVRRYDQQCISSHFLVGGRYKESKARSDRT